MTGNFSGLAPIYDPSNVLNGLRQQFPGNIIPMTRLDQVGTKIAALYPRPNLSGNVNNYGTNQVFLNNGNQLDSRIDQQFTEHDNAFFRYSRGTDQLDLSTLCPPPGDCGDGALANLGSAPTDTPLGAWPMATGETHIFTPNLVNEFHWGYSHKGLDQVSTATQSLFSQFGFLGIPNSYQIVGLPQISVKCERIFQFGRSAV